MSLQEIPLEQGVKAHAAGDNRLQLEQDFEAHALILSRQSTVCLALRVRVWDACFSFRGVRVTVLVLLAILFAATFFVIENNHHHDLARNSTNFTCIAESNSSVCVGPSDFEETRLTFSDALFLSVSVISATGLQTVDFSQWSVASQIIAMFEMFLGSLLISSTVPLVIMIILARKRGDPKINGHRAYSGLLLVLVVIYFYYIVFMVVLGALFASYCAKSPDIRSIFLSASPPLDPWYGGYFMALTSFSNCGFSVFSNSAASFATSPGLQIWLCVFMLSGNVAFPLLLHCILRLMRLSGLEKHANLPLSLVLESPRMFYNFLFPAHYLLFLSSIWITMYVINFAMCLGLEWSNTMSGLNVGEKIMAATFTSVASRTTGLNVLPTGSFQGALLVFELIVFVISSNPNAITMRATSRASGTRTVQEYTKELLINVVAGLTLCWILILLFENSNPYVSAFPVLFEVASAFGTIGLSMGFGDSPLSLCGSFSLPSKLTIIVLMLFGCHRTLPANVDPFLELLASHVDPPSADP